MSGVIIDVMPCQPDGGRAWQKNVECITHS